MKFSNQFLDIMLDFVNRNKKSSHPVVVDDGKAVHVFESIRAAADYFGICEDSIGDASRGLANTAGGRKFYRLLKR